MEVGRQVNDDVQDTGAPRVFGAVAPIPENHDPGCEEQSDAACCMTDAAVAANQSEAREPCPTPLAWQHVVRSVREESQSWELDRGDYVLRGRTFGTGKPLYFLNGLGGTHELYALIAWLLRENFRCVLYDYPAAETKSARWVKLSTDVLAADLLSVADHHADQQFCVYANSFGSPIALTAMLQQPERIERAVLQSGFAYRKLSLAERALTAICRHVPGCLHKLAVRRVIQEQSHRRWFPPYDITRWRFFLENTGQVPISALAQRAAALKTCDLRGRLGEIACPVLLIRTEGEGFVSARSREELEAGLPNASSEYLHTSGHLVYLTHPHRLSKVIQPFLFEETELPSGG
jgi:pimeloyl-ACP methyl ester carboxylesterase